MFLVDLHDCGAVPGAVFQAALLSVRRLAEKTPEKRLTVRAEPHIEMQTGSGAEKEQAAVGKGTDPVRYLQVGEGGADEQPVYTGTLKIKQNDESNWKYVSYQKENWSYVGETLSMRE